MTDPKQAAADFDAIALRIRDELVMELAHVPFDGDAWSIRFAHLLRAVLAEQAAPVAATCFHTIHPKDAVDDHGFAISPGRYALYPFAMPLYAAPAAASSGMVSEDDKEALRMVKIMLEAPVGECCLTRSVIDGRLCMAAFGTIEPGDE